MRVALSVVLVGVALAQLALAQDQTTPKLSWKERAKLDYQRRYEKYILHKQVDDENTIEGGSGSESSNVIPLGTRIGLSPPPPPVVVTRPPPPPTTTASWRLPPPSTTPYRPPPPPPTTTTTPRPPPPSTTSRPPPPPPTPFRPLPTTTRPPPPPTRPAPRPTTTNIRRTTEAPVVVPDVGLRGAFGDDDAPVSPEAAAAPAVLSAPAAAPAAVPAVLPAPAAAGTASGGVPAFGEGQGTMSGTFQGRPGALPANTGFASSSATAFSSGGVAGGSSASTAGTTNAGGAATGTFTVSVGGGGSASASTTGAVSKSPVALLGKVVQGIVRPITAILPAPLGPRGSNPGLIGGLVSGGFEVLDGSIRAIYPEIQKIARRNARGSGTRRAPAAPARTRRGAPRGGAASVVKVVEGMRPAP